MNVLDEVRSRLNAKHAGLRYTEADGTILVHASTPGGFVDWISDALDALVVGYDGWHEHFDTPEQALECFAFAFSDRCRLKVSYRGKVAHKWSLESLQDGRWVEDSTTGSLFFPFWRAERIEYRQNGRPRPG